MSDLNRSIAEAMGWRLGVTTLGAPVYAEGHAEPYPYGNWKPLPDFEHSLDALSDGPEKVLREGQLSSS